MMRSAFLLTPLVFAIACGGMPQDEQINGKIDGKTIGPTTTEPSPTHEPPMLGLHKARGSGGGGGSTGSINMTWHNGAILTSTSVTAIFWGVSWGTFAGDKITGLDSFY